MAKAEKEAEKELLRAADASRRLEKEATAKVAAAAKRLAKAEKKAEIDSLRAADTSRKAVKRAAVEIATATESVAHAKKEVIELGKRAKQQRPQLIRFGVLGKPECLRPPVSRFYV